MLILVGVTVAVALNGGLFDQARKASKGMTMAQIQEKADMVKALLIADLQTNEGVVVVKQEYMDRLQQEFEDSEIKGNKVIVEDGKYGIIVKNGDLDIEITENPNYVDKSELLTLKATPTEITEDGKVYGIEIALNLEANITSEEYVAQETEKAKNISYEEKEKAVLELILQEIDEPINSFDDYVLWYLNSMDEEITHSTLDANDPEGWFNKNNKDDLINVVGWDEEEDGPFPEEEEDIRSLIYHVMADDDDLETKWTEKDVIQIIYVENINSWTFKYEYYTHTNNLEIYPAGEQILGDLSGYWDVDDDSIRIAVNKNGSYKFVVQYEENIITSEVIQVNNIETNNPYLLTEEEAKDIWMTSGDGRITAYRGTDKIVAIPSYIGKEKIVKTYFSQYNIGNFKNCTNITIPDTLETIGSYTFYQCTLLTEIVIPNSVKEIGEGAFASSGLNEVEIPSSVASLDRWSFAECNNLIEVVIPSNVKNIYTQAFANCKNLQSFTCLGSCVLSDRCT